MGPPGGRLIFPSVIHCRINSTAFVNVSCVNTHEMTSSSTASGDTSAKLSFQTWNSMASSAGSSWTMRTANRREGETADVTRRPVVFQRILMSVGRYLRVGRPNGVSHRTKGVEECPAVIPLSPPAR